MLYMSSVWYKENHAIWIMTQEFFISLPTQESASQPIIFNLDSAL